MPTPNPQKIDYCFTPSQLNAFQDFLDSEYLWGQFWGNSEEPAKTAEEFAAECEKKLIDQINRCPKEANLAADRGTCFNAVVDFLINPRNSLGEVKIHDYTECDGEVAIPCELNNLHFLFSRDLCASVAARYPNAISQYHCGAPLHTDKGVVWIYGYLDEWCGCKISDIKTCKEYAFGKYERGWQKHAYPYAVVESGDCTEITEFEYTAIQLFTKKNPVIHGKVYPEVYTYDHEQSRRLLQYHCEKLIDWLEHRRDLITDAKIFGGENPPGYVGEPIDIGVLLRPDQRLF